MRVHETALLGDHEISVACVLPGDLLCFSSAALHFATNGADGMNAALYHGMVTHASLPRLEEVAARRAAGERRAGAVPEMGDDDDDCVALSALEILEEIRSMAR